MDMIVSLGDCRVAACSRTSTFQYIAFHIRNPSLLSARSPLDHFLPIDNSLLYNHTQNGISYEADDILEFNPEVGPYGHADSISL